MAAYLKASNFVVLTDAGQREVGLLQWLTHEDMANLEELCSMSEAYSKALNKYYALKVVKANPFYNTAERRKVIYTRIAVSKLKQSGIVVPTSGKHVLSDLCRVAAKALTLIRDYRVKLTQTEINVAGNWS